MEALYTMSDPISNNIPLKATVRLVEPKGKLQGFASVVVGDSLAIDNFRIMAGANGLYVGMPGYLDSAKKSHDLCRPMSKEFYAQLEATVLDAYHRRIEKALAAVEPKQDAPTQGLADKLAAAKERVAAYNAALPAPAPSRAQSASL